MRYIKVALLITLVMMLLTGCSAETTLIYEDEGYFLEFAEPTEKPILIGYQMAPEIRFKSIKEMLHTIRTGRFSKAQMREVIDFKWDEQGRVILFDLDHVLEPVYPSDYEELTVIWGGDTYNFTLTSSSGRFAPFSIYSAEYHAEQVEHYSNFDEFRECDRVSTENRDGIEVTVFDYTTTDFDAYGNRLSTPHRLCTYTLTDDNTELFIHEQYDPNTDLENPTSVSIFGKTANDYFHVFVNDPATRPTPQWLLCFDVRSYQDNASGKTETTVQTQYDNAYYSITEKDSRFTLTPKLPLSVLGSCCSTLVYPKFTSVAEMQQGIINGPISEYELCSLTRSSDSIEICDPNRLYECTAPAEFDLEYISWCGTYYAFNLTSETAWGGIDCYDEASYTESFNRGYKDFLTNPLVTLTKQTNTPNRSATVYYYNTSVAKLKDICYEISVGDKKMYVQERYLLEHEDSDEPVSSDVPTHIEFWGTENGGYFYGNFFDLTERPSVEWLSQFGIIPYEEK